MYNHTMNDQEANLISQKSQMIRLPGKGTAGAGIFSLLLL